MVFFYQFSIVCENEGTMECYSQIVHQFIATYIDVSRFYKIDREWSWSILVKCMKVFIIYEKMKPMAWRAGERIKQIEDSYYIWNSNTNRSYPCKSLWPNSFLVINLEKVNLYVMHTCLDLSQLISASKNYPTSKKISQLLS